jgi:hypothetical protein
MVHLTLATDDGANPERVRTDLSTRAAADCATYVASLSTRARLDQFAHDFAAASPGYSFRDLGDGTVEMTLAGAMEFMTRKDYTDNWVSECCERFTDMNLDSWTALLTDVGFDIAPATHAWTNEWLVANRFDPVARLTDTQDVPLPWPATHVLVVALRPALG